jgi:hypothetical protein
LLHPSQICEGDEVDVEVDVEEEELQDNQKQNPS